MTPSRIYQKCEEPEQTIVGNIGIRRAGSVQLPHCTCASERTSISILFLLNVLLFFLWIITLSLVVSKHSEMAQELKELQSNQTVLRMNGSNMEKQLERLHLNQSSYGLKLNENLKMSESNKNMLKEVDKQLGHLRSESQKLWEGSFRLTDAVHKMNVSACQVCPEGWLLNKGQCYLFQVASQHWSFAKRSCEEQDSHLVIINDAEEQVFLGSQKKKKISLWIGLHDTNTENKFEWVDGTSASYTHWYPREPNNAGHGEDCVVMNSFGWWNDLGCGSTTDGWICEKTWKC